MSLLKQALEGGAFAVTAEMAPPKGFDFAAQLADALLLQRVTGHTPPVDPSTQSPHILQYSLNMPTRSICPRNMVLLAG